MRRPEPACGPWGWPPRLFLRTVSKVVGSEVVNDTVGFFTAFEGMEQGFRDRAQEVLTLLSRPGTAFVLVTTPRPARRRRSHVLRSSSSQESKIDVDALVVNRMYPTFAGGDPRAGGHAEPGAGARLLDNLEDLSRVAAGKKPPWPGCTAQVPAPVVRVPYLDTDVHDLDGLAEVSRALFGPDRAS